MTITREQVKDLQPGDVVELSGHPSQFGSTTRGPLYEREGHLYVGDRLVRYADGWPNKTYADRMHLTVVSRAPRPLYVNHPRTGPVCGDVVQVEHSGAVFMRTREYGWIDRNGDEDDLKRKDGLHLLVDGETGQAVQ